MTETERTEEKKRGDRGPEGSAGRERKKSRMPGGESHIGRSWELGSVPKNSWRSRSSRETRPQIGCSTSFFPVPLAAEKYELITARRILRMQIASVFTSCHMFYEHVLSSRFKSTMTTADKKATLRKFRYRFRLLPTIHKDRMVSVITNGNIYIYINDFYAVSSTGEGR